MAPEPPKKAGKGGVPPPPDQPKKKVDYSQVRLVGGDPEQDVDEMRKVFNSYVAAKKKVGDDTSGADFEKFRTALVKQSRQLIDSGKAQAVAYRIEIQDGKVAIKAKGE